jgi:hypothetical protein
VSQRTFFGTLRLGVLLAILVFVALGAWLDRVRSRDWDAPLRITVYPVAASTAADLRAYTAALSAEDFRDVEDFFRTEAASYGVILDPPVRLRVSRAATAAPPALPERPGRFTIALWSLRMRYFAARTAWRDPLPTPDIQVFALYSPLRPGAAAMPDSIGLSKGLMAVTHLYADARAAGSNQVVLAHEVLHTLGATDKYDLASGQPLAPAGLAEPDRRPLYPQRFGEIMGGRIATAADTAVIAGSLEDMRVGPQTAGEIGWGT